MTGDPAEMSDPTDGAPLDSVSFEQNADAALARYRVQGFHIESGILPARDCDELVAAALTLPNAASGTFGPIPMPHRVHPKFLAVMRYPPIVEIVETLIGAKASGIGGEFFYMRPGTAGFTAHQDNYYVEAPTEAFLSVWIALCDVGPDNGGLVFYPGSHKLGPLPVREGQTLSDAGQNPAAQAIECLVPVGAPAVPIHLKKGSIAFFHGLLAHYSYPNSSDRFRYSFLATYIRAGAPFKPGRTQQRTEIDLHTLS